MEIESNNNKIKNQKKHRKSVFFLGFLCFLLLFVMKKKKNYQKRYLHNPRTTPSTSKSVKHSSVQGWTISGDRTTHGTTAYKQKYETVAFFKACAKACASQPRVQPYGF